MKYLWQVDYKMRYTDGDVERGRDFIRTNSVDITNALEVYGGWMDIDNMERLDDTYRKYGDKFGNHLTVIHVFRLQSLTVFDEDDGIIQMKVVREE